MASSFLKRALALIGRAIPAVTPTRSVAAEPLDQVIVYLTLSTEFGAGGESFALYGVEDAIAAAITSVGEVDAHEIGGGYFTISTRGENADILLQAIRPALNDPLVLPGSYVLVRREGTDAPGHCIDLTPHAR